LEPNLKLVKKISIFLFFIVTAIQSYAQQTVISGKVTDASTGEAIPYARVYFKHLRQGTTTNFEGFYKMEADKAEDSLTVEYLGYNPKSKAIKKGQVQLVNFQMEPTEMQVEQVVVHPGENPAFRILRGVWAHRSQNDKTSLKAYQYQSYSKIEISANNISDEFKNGKLMKPFKNIFDSIKMISGDDGKTLIPFFISETISDVFYLKTPELKSEHIKGSKLSGVGLTDGSLASQLVGSSLQDYNFYQNWLNIIDKGFISPIADGGIGFYHYYLIDSMVIDGKYCYKIEFKPRHEKDLAFSGTMWINDTTFGLKRIIVEVGKKANLNFIKSLHIQQDLVQTSTGAWMPAKERITVDISEIAGKTFGVLGKLYVSNGDFVVDKPLKLKAYEDKITQDEEALYREPTYWDKNRPDSLTKEDKTVLHIIDTIKNMPNIKTAVDIADIIVNGYYKIGKISIGPYILALGDNVVEGYRLRLGFKTNEDFSRYWVFKGYAAAGNQDWNTNHLKYSLSAEHFLSRKSWTKVGIQHLYDIQGLGVPDDFFDDNNLLTAAAQLGFLTRLNIINVNRIWIESDIVKGFNVRAYLIQKSYTPQPNNDYQFAYYPGNNPLNPVATKLNTTEADFEARIAFKETYIINGNRRASIGFDPAPIFSLHYIHGFNGLLGGQFNYNRVTLGLEQNVKMGTLGHADYALYATKVFEQLPYQLLIVQPGNETIFRTFGTFNMMNFFEFVSDQSLTAIYTHHFDGIFFNRIPLLKLLKWREVVGIKGLWGNISPQNDINNPLSTQYPQNTGEGKPLTKFYTLNPNLPYLEVSYGVENIFRFFRVEFLQRLDYLSIRPNVQQFGVKGSFYFAF